MKDTKFRPGKSGNPSGRKPGSGKITQFRAAINGHVPAILSKLAEMAKDGDVQAARLLLERTVPRLRPITPSQPIKLSGSATEQLEGLLTALAEGSITSEQASSVAQVLLAMIRAKEADELEPRIAALEQQREDRQ